MVPEVRVEVNQAGGREGLRLRPVGAVPLGLTVRGVHPHPAAVRAVHRDQVVLPVRAQVLPPRVAAGRPAADQATRLLPAPAVPRPPRNRRVPAVRPNPPIPAARPDPVQVVRRNRPIHQDHPVQAGHRNPQVRAAPAALPLRLIPAARRSRPVPEPLRDRQVPADPHAPPVPAVRPVHPNQAVLRNLRAVRAAALPGRWRFSKSIF